VTELAVQARGEVLAVLGAGNCNDLDLEVLSRSFREIHLVDLDYEALRRARARQKPDVARKLVLRAPVDLSGALHRLMSFRRRPSIEAQLASLPSACTDSVLAAVPERFDAVLSACVLSQLLHACAVAMTPSHPHLPAVSCALVLAHVRSTALLLKPGGTGVLVTDMASSEASRDNESWGGQERETLARNLEESHRCASGTGPAFLARLMDGDRVLTPLLDGAPQPVKPWVWQFGETLSYLVHAMVFRRAEIDAEPALAISRTRT
jgi:hypothetical protein